MGYGLTYRLKFTNLEGFDIVCLIQDSTTFALNAEENIKDLTPAGEPLVINVVDTDEDKYTSVRAKRADIKFLSDINFNVSLFALNSSDNRWKVDIYIDNPSNPVFLGEHHPIFTGFLLLNDLNEPYLDSYNNEIISLTAIDGLALLKDTPLTKPNGTNPKGKFTIIQYIAWCLQKTGLNLPINVMNNLMEESFQGLPAYNNIKIWAKTFEGDTIGVCINCYDVLQQILGEECFLTQWKNQWWIKRIDEIENDLNYFDNYDYQGIYTGTSSNINFFKNIGLAQSIELIAPPTMVTFDRPYSFIKETFNLESFKEIIDNIDFTRGQPILLIVIDMGQFINSFANLASFPAIGDPNITYKAIDTAIYYRWNGVTYIPITNDQVPYGAAYFIDDWTTGVYLSSDVPTTDTAFIVRRFVGGYEKERYVRLKQPDTRVFYIQSNPFPIDFKDKFSISVDTRLSDNIGSGSGFRRSGVMQVKLYGDNGQNYFLHGPSSVDPTPRWVLTDDTFSINTDFVYVEDDVSDDETNWVTASCSAPPAPVSGNIIIVLLNWGPNVDLPAETHFQNLQFSYEPYINNSYQKYSGQYNKVSKNILDLKAKRDKQVYITDSPKQLLKGALFKTINGKDIIAGRWYNGAVTFIRFTNPVDPQYLHPLGFLQAFSVWNQFKREMRRLDFQASGLDSGTDMPDLLHNYIFSDYSPHTYGKKFLLIHYEMDLYRCKWKGHMQEVFDFQRPKAYNDNFEFKFIENR